MSITPLEVFSAICLSVVGVLAAVGIFCRNYHENWFQFLGLVGIAVWSCARVTQLTDMTSTRLPAQGALLHASMALYALGTAFKVWQHRPKADPPPPAPYKIERDQLRQVAGGR